MTTYDYIVVGAGSAGCVLANRLSADLATTVCLLEAGPEDTNPFIHMPIGIVWLMMSRKLNWQYYTQPQSHLNERRLYWPRGKMLGGSSSSNAMCYSRGHPIDYDQWAAFGNKGWGYADVLPLFKRSENHERGASEHHGVGGPLNVADLRSPNLLGHVFLKAAVQAGFPENGDFSGARQEGVGPYQVTQKDGERWSMSRAYLRPVRGRANLTVITDARAARIVLEDKRATGVVFVKDGQEIEIGAARELILSGGAINSPQLLLLSGIGPQDDLKKFGIPAAHHLPGVGKNLQDHLDVLIVRKCTKPVSLGVSLRNLPHQLKHLYDYLRWKKGPLTTNGAEAGGFVKSDSRQPIPDLQLHFTPVHLDGHARDASYAAATMLGHGFALHVCQLRPNSRGQITLASGDPLANAVIEPNYLGDPADMEAMVAAVKLARRVLAAPAFDEYRGEEMQPGEHVQSDDEIKEFIRCKAETIYHPVGTCKMGHDAMAVVDDRLKVHGIDGLRVVDASIMPTLIGGNTNAPTVMIAEKAADMILAEALEAASEFAATSAAQRMPAATRAIAKRVFAAMAA
jgi:choline dehydrogenase